MKQTFKMLCFLLMFSATVFTVVQMKAEVQPLGWLCIVLFELSLSELITRFYVK